MKKILSILCASFFILMITSCVDDDKLWELDDFETGAIPNMQRTSNDLGFVNLLDISGSTLEFTVDFTVDQTQSTDGGLTNQGDGRTGSSTEFNQVESVQVEVSFQGTASGGVTESGFLQTITSWPTTLTFNGIEEIIAVLTSIDDEDDIQLGDVFTFVCGVTLSDGRVLPAFVTDPSGSKTPNYSINFTGNLNNPGLDIAVPYVVTCPSNLAGNYTSTVLSSSIALTNFRTPQPVTVTGSNGSYVLSDGSADYFGPDFPIGLAFNELCESITITPGSVQYPTQVIWDLNSGSLDSGTGVITLDLTYNSGSCCALAGIQYVLELSPQ